MSRTLLGLFVVGNLLLVSKKFSSSCVVVYVIVTTGA